MSKTKSKGIEKTFDSGSDTLSSMIAPKNDVPLAKPESHPTVPEDIRAPDGGWGWVVVFCSFMIHVIVDGITYTFGIFYLEFLRFFGESKGATSWVSSLLVAVTLLVGPLASGLTKEFGCRTVAIIGSLLATAGLVISTFSTSIWFLYLSIGICTATGFGLMYLPAIVCVTLYFERKQAFAMGVAVCGAGIGTTLLAPLIEWAVVEWGWQGAMLLTAGLVLNCCVFGALFRPIEVTPRAPLQASCKGVLRKGSMLSGTVVFNGEVSLSSSHVESLNLQSPSHLSLDPHFTEERIFSITLNSSSRRESVSQKEIINSQQSSDIPKRLSSRLLECVRRVLTEMTDFHLLGNPIFILFAFSNFFTSIGFDVPYLYTKDRAIGLAIADETRASYLLSVIGISNTVGRLVLGYLSDRPFVNRLWLYSGCLTLCGFATAFSSFCATYALMGGYVVVFGVTSGAFLCLTSAIIIDLMGVEAVANAFGILLLVNGVAVLIGPPITGWLHDYTGTYDSGFYVSGSLIAISGLMLFFIPCFQSYLDKKQSEKEGKNTLQTLLHLVQNDNPVLETKRTAVCCEGISTKL